MFSNKRIIALILLIGIGIVIVLIGFGVSLIRGSNGSTSSVLEPLKNKVDLPVLGPESIDSQRNALLAGPSSVWIPVDESNVDAAKVPDYKEEVEGAVLVRISEYLTILNASDEISIAVPQEDTAYATKVSTVKDSLGIVSYGGRLMEHSYPLSFMITVGQSSVFANFSTPNATYELVGNREYAWLMDVAKMDQHVDYSKPDYYIVRETPPAK